MTLNHLTIDCFYHNNKERSLPSGKVQVAVCRHASNGDLLVTVGKNIMHMIVTETVELSKPYHVKQVAQSILASWLAFLGRKLKARMSIVVKQKNKE